MSNLDEQNARKGIPFFKIMWCAGNENGQLFVQSFALRCPNRLLIDGNNSVNVMSWHNSCMKRNTVCQRLNNIKWDKKGNK